MWKVHSDRNKHFGEQRLKIEKRGLTDWNRFPKDEESDIWSSDVGLALESH